MTKSCLLCIFLFITDLSWSGSWWIRNLFQDQGWTFHRMRLWMSKSYVFSKAYYRQHIVLISFILGILMAAVHQKKAL